MEHVWVACETPLPVPMADDNHRCAAGLMILFREAPAQRRQHTPDLHKTRRHVRPPNPLWDLACCVGYIFGVVAGDRLKRGVEPVPVIEPNRGYIGYGTPLPGFVQRDQTIGVRKRKRLEQHGVKRREHGAVRADSERKRRHDRDCESRRAAQDAHRIANILQ